MVKLQLIQSRLNFSQTNELQMYPPKNWMLCYQAKIFKNIPALFLSILGSSVQSRSLPCREGLFKFNIT